MNREELESYILNHYSTEPDYPWADTPRAAVFRHAGNRKWFALVKANPGMSFEVDLEAEVVKAGDKTYSFSIDAFRRHCMLNGLDSIGLTLQHEDAISAYEKKQPAFMG